jgi:integrase
MAKKQKRRPRGQGCLFQKTPNGTYYARWQSEGKVFIRSCQTTSRRDAEKLLSEFTAPFRLGSEAKTLETVAARLGGVQDQIAKIDDAIPSTAIKHGWQTYLNQVNRPDTGESTLKMYELQYEAFARWTKEHHPGVTELRQVTQAHADEYAGHLQKKLSASTFNRHRNLLALVWRVLKKQARLTINPWSEITRKRHTVQSRRELTVEELQRVIEASSGQMRLLLALGIYCGLRLGDAALLDWGNVDMMKGIISVVPAKTARRSGKRVTLPIHRTLFDMLAAVPSSKRRGYVMPDIAARYQSFDGALAKDILKLFSSVNIKTGAKRMTAAEIAEGVAVKKIKGKTKRALPECGFHSLRHTFVSLCAAGGVPQSVVQSLVGHGSPAMTQHYTHVSNETARNAVAMLPEIGTHANTLPEGTGATGAKLGAVLAMLDGLNDAELKALIGSAKDTLKKRAKPD